MVFIDDDAVQCGLAKSQLPALRVLQWPHAFNGIRSLDDLLLFDSLVSTNEDRSRTEMYQAERRRRAARADGDSPEQYIASLGLDVNVGDARAVDLSRIAQLSQRTNQFNLTTRRYDVSGLESLVSDSNVRVMWIEARDRFGDYGVVGCGIVRREQDEAVIDTFLLSCRVLGRQLERVVANRLAARARVLGAATLIGDYIPSGRNAQVADLYTRLDFEGPKENGGTKRWRWTLAKGDPTVPEWMKMSDSAETRE
jgi:FkbH-like protein